MFSNQNTPIGNKNAFSMPNQNQSSPFGNTFQAGGVNSSLFQSPTPSVGNVQQSTPSFLNNTFNPQPASSSAFNTGFGSQNTFGNPIQATNNTQTSTFPLQSQQGQLNSFSQIRPSSSVFGNTNTFSAFGQSSQQNQPSLIKPITSAIPLGPGPSSFGSSQPAFSVNQPTFSSSIQQPFSTSTFGSSQPNTNFGTNSNMFAPQTQSIQQPSQPFNAFSSNQPQNQSSSGFTGFGNQQPPATTFSGFNFQSQPITTSQSLFGSSGFNNQPSSTFSSSFSSSIQPTLGSNNSQTVRPFGSSNFGSLSFPSTTQSSFNSYGITNSSQSNTQSGFPFGSQPMSSAQNQFPTMSQNTLSQPTFQSQTNQPIFGSSFGTQSTVAQNQSIPTFGFNTNQANQPGSLFGGSTSSSAPNIFGQSSSAGNTFGSSFSQPQPQNSNMPISSSIFSQTQPSLFQNPSISFPSNTMASSSSFSSSFGSNMQQQQPPQNIFGGGMGSTFNSQPVQLPSQPTLNLTSMSSSSMPSTLQPVSQSIIFPGTPNLSTLINTQPDKSIDMFGYRASASRFGPVEYFSSSYNTPPDTQNVTDNSLNTSANKSLQDIEGFSYNSYEYDIKLGNTLNANNDTELREVPLDTITRLRFSPHQSDLLACASWDGSVSVFKVEDSFSRNGCARVNVHGCIFDLDWLNSNVIAMAGSNGSIYTFDINVHNYSEFSKHSGPVKSVRTSMDFSNMIISGSYDGCVKIWDARTRSSVASISGGGKVMGMDLCKNGFVFFNSDREVMVYKYNDFNRPQHKQKIETSQVPLRCIAISTFNCRKEGGFVVTVGTTGGKISVIAQSNNVKDFTFRVHRMPQPNRTNAQYAFPVHDIVFHPTSYVLSLAGGDGAISLWDIQKHSNVLTLNRSSLPVTSLSYNKEGRLLAYAVGYDWSRGIKGYKYRNMKPAIFIRKCDQELKYPCPNQTYY